jgi:hypothetical protein
VRAARTDGSVGSITEQHRLTSFFGACEVSCRVRAERDKPYALTSSRERDSPRDQLGRNIGSPAPQSQTGARRIGSIWLLGEVFAPFGELSTLLRIAPYSPCPLGTLVGRLPLFTNCLEDVFSETQRLLGRQRARACNVPGPFRVYR